MVLIIAGRWGLCNALYSYGASEKLSIRSDSHYRIQDVGLPAVVARCYLSGRTHIHPVHTRYR